MQIPSSGRCPPGAGRNAQPSAARAAPGETPPESARSRPDADATWSPDAQPYHARASFLKLCLPAVLYSLVAHASLKVLRLVPFASRLRVGVEELHPRDCFSPPAGGEGAASSVAVVTGSNTGVGYETALGLAERGHHVILACRSRAKGEAAAERINGRLKSIAAGEGPDGRPAHFVRGGEATFLAPLDLSSFGSVREFCRAFEAEHDALNVLVNNAGTNAQGDVTEDGLESCFQSNTMGHFLLTKLLLDRLLKAKNAYPAGSDRGDEAGRIVNLSSVTHHFAPANERAPAVPAHDPGGDAPRANGIHDGQFWLGCATPGVSSGTYRESKLASILFAMELNKRYGSRGVRSVAVNPGSVFSDIWRDESDLAKRLYEKVYLTTRQGSTTSIAGAIGAVPEGALYLQPYWQSSQGRNEHASGASGCSSFRLNYGLPFAMMEMLGPYVGYAVTEPRLPLDGCGGYKSSEALWQVLERLVSSDDQ